MIGIVVGLAGIYVTALQSADALNALADLLRGAAVPSQYKSLAGGIQFFGVGLIIAVSYAFFGVGLTATGRPILAVLGAKRPTLSSFFFVLSLSSVAAALALAGYTSTAAAIAIAFGIWFFSLSAFACTIPSTKQDDGEDAAFLLVAFLIPALVAGVYVAFRFLAGLVAHV
ncbi:MAG: hypothetical protein KGJ79_09190 [Alphaproteobacteria bacterium]|nr:hypothetical protein [Alphaproteobacteria bacterium]MDE2111306.1 hypothetical protein [Alphaproteobacteria bacterium]